jgi:hypothetical protein
MSDRTEDLALCLYLEEKGCLYSYRMYLVVPGLFALLTHRAGLQSLNPHGVSDQYYLKCRVPNLSMILG